MSASALDEAGKMGGRVSTSGLAPSGLTPGNFPGGVVTGGRVTGAGFMALAIDWSSDNIGFAPYRAAIFVTSTSSALLPGGCCAAAQKAPQDFHHRHRQSH
jgi:hypothetical protein